MLVDSEIIKKNIKLLDTTDNLVTTLLYVRNIWRCISLNTDFSHERPSLLRPTVQFSRLSAYVCRANCNDQRACISRWIAPENRGNHRQVALVRDLGTKTLFPLRRNEYFMASTARLSGVVRARDSQTAAWLLLGQLPRLIKSQL